MIDLHCHILPELDDGPDVLAESLQMAEIAAAGGIRAIVATPHAGNGLYPSKPADIAGRVADFNADLADASIPLKVYPGAEVQLSPGLAERLHQGKVTTINNSRYILLELPPILLPDSCKSELSSLLNNGFIPVIGHAERHSYLQKNLAYLAGLVQMGVLCQVTAGSLLGRFGRNVKAVAEQMLQCCLAHIIASDAHGVEGRVPALEGAVSEAARLLDSREKAMRMVTAIPAAIIADSNVYVEPPAMDAVSSKKTPWYNGGGSFFSTISDFWSRA
jgi:protein-tyrosine phosphatase